MTQKKTEEVEDFEEMLITSSGQLALIDASAIRDLQHPEVKNAIMIPTKQSRGQEVTFKVKAEYDDAILRQLIMEPAPKQEREQVEEGVQLRGHDRSQGSVAGTVGKKIAKIEQIASGEGKPNKAQRKKRNEKAKKSHVETNPIESMKAKMAEKVAGKGASNDNYGQPRTKTESQIFGFLNKIKTDTIQESDLEQIEDIDNLRFAFVSLRKKCIKEENYKNFDLIYKAIQVLEEHWYKTSKSRMLEIENLLREGLIIERSRIRSS